MPPKLVIFDCDGVLVDSETIANEVIVHSLASYDLTLEFDHCMDLFVGTSDNYMQATAKKMGAQLPPDWLEEIDRKTFARLRQGVPVIAGVVNIIDQLEALDIEYCVASNGSDEKMAITLGQTGLLQRFENARFSAHSIGISKPDPGLFLYAAKHFNAPPETCIVIEDSPSGAKAARRANMKCFGYAPHNEGQKLSTEGAQVFRHMEELAGLLGIG